MTATPQGGQNMAYDCAHFHKENVERLSLFSCRKANICMECGIIKALLGETK